MTYNDLTDGAVKTQIGLCRTVRGLKAAYYRGDTKILGARRLSQRVKVRNTVPIFGSPRGTLLYEARGAKNHDGTF
jgi:hypothetical protein